MKDATVNHKENLILFQWSVQLSLAIFLSTLTVIFSSKKAVLALYGIGVIAAATFEIMNLGKQVSAGLFRNGPFYSVGLTPRGKKIRIETYGFVPASYEWKINGISAVLCAQDIMQKLVLSSVYIMVPSRNYLH